ncbi:MAG: Uma2 family endonuclease [Acidobacteriota bacterium]
MSYPVTRRRFSVAEYHQMIASAILTKEDRVELLNGEIVEMSPISPNHAAAVKRVSKLLYRRVADEVTISVQDPIQLDDFSEPQPDIALVKSRDDFYKRAHPKPADILLLIEVAESSALRDRVVKTPAYANASIPELWIVDLQQDLIERYSDPLNGAYQLIQKVLRGDTLSPRLLPSLVIRVEDLLG